MRVLLADDDEAIAMVARLGLRRAGGDVTVVDNGTDALALALSGGFDVLVLDWNMPGLDGIDVCRQLTASADWTRVPIVFLTAASHEGAHEEALAAGAAGIIAKPFDPMTVGERVRVLARL